MNRQPVNSSMITSIGYDLEEETLEVEFVANGDIYQYFNVPYQVYNALMEASSKGNFMKDNVMNVYDYSKVNRKKKR